MEPQYGHDDSSCSYQSSGELVQRSDVEFEELLVSDTVGLSLHGTNLGVCGFHLAGNDSMVEVGEYALPVPPETFGSHWIVARDARYLSLGNP